ncbi:MAG: low temperature requirement protein A [Mycobacterium sp.]|nr:low temperature requirement protein A [Mycobacterium sp.]
MATAAGPGAGRSDVVSAESHPQAGGAPLVSRVSPLELFFDLVFVFALTEVTGLLAAEISVANFMRGVAVLMAVWWAWVGFSWLTTARDAEGEWRRLSIVLAMAAMLVVGIAIPQSFGNDALVFALGYAAVMVLFVVTYALSVRDDPEMLRAVLRLGAGAIVVPVLMIGAALVGPGLARTAMIVLALLIAYAAPFLAGTMGWQISPSHFAERYGLIIIIALGETVVSIGIGAADEPLGWPIVVGVTLAVLIVAGMWWLYFDVVARVAEHRLAEVTGLERNALARDAYTYLHLPMVVGIVFLALGLKKALAEPDATLKMLVALALFGGVALYLLAHVAFRWRSVRSVNFPRSIVAGMLLACVPLGKVLPALASVALIAVVVNALVVYEVVRYRDARARIREAGRH